MQYFQTWIQTKIVTYLVMKVVKFEKFLLYMLACHVIASKMNLMVSKKNASKQFLYKVNDGNYFYPYSPDCRWHYFVLTHSCYSLPFYYTSQPSHKLTKALYIASHIIKNVKKKFQIYYIQAESYEKTI